MSSKEVYRIPECKNIEGLNLHSKYYNYVFSGRIDDFRLKKGEDTLICSYPRTGTTWTSQIISLLLASDADYERVKATRLTDRVLYLDLSEEQAEPMVTRLDSVPPPRVSKTHLKYKLIRRWLDEDQVKFIIPTRNPKDALVSIFHQYKDTVDYNFEQHTWDDFFEHVCAGLQEHGDMHEWLLDWSQHRHNPNVLFVSYEDMKKDIRTEVRKMVEFLGLEVSEEKLTKVLHDSNVKQMQRDSAVQQQDAWMKEGASFVRKGQSGGWRNYFTVAQSELYDAKYKKLYAQLPIKVHYE